MTYKKRTVNPFYYEVSTRKYDEDGSYQHGLFYSKPCLFCKEEFEARRQETAFCSQRCQKAYQRKINLEQRHQELQKTF